MTTTPAPKPLDRMKIRNAAASLNSVTSPALYDEYDLDPPCQRGSVWGKERQVALIESTFRGVGIGVIVTNLRPEDPHTYRVVDGKQRIEALRAWVNGDIAVPAWWFRADELPAEHGDTITFAALPHATRSDWQFSSIAVQECNVPESMEQTLFDLINFGGVSQGNTDLAVS